MSHPVGATVAPSGIRADHQPFFGGSVDVSPRVYALIWCGVVGIHIACGSFLATVGWVYLYLRMYSLPILGNMELYHIGVHQRFFKGIAGTYFLVAAWHAYCLVGIVRDSIKHRHLSLSSSPVVPDISRSRLASMAERVASRIVGASTQNPLRGWQQSRLVQWVLMVVGWFRVVWSAFSVTDRNYGTVYITRELIQNGLQTYQAYRSSYLVAHQWMNRVMVLLLVINCWSTPLIQHTLRSSLVRTRLICMVINVVLDCVAYVVFPSALFLPYYRIYNTQEENFDLRYWYTDRWLIQMVNEWQMLFVTSFWDGMSKFWIAFNVTRALRALPRLVQRRDLKRRTSTGGPNDGSIVPAPVEHKRDAAVSSKPAHLPHKPSWSARFEWAGQRSLLVWGFIVLVFHVHATSNGENRQCLVQVRPWGSSRPACSLMEFSCLKDANMTGSALEFDRAIESIDKEWLAYLIIRHCPAVEVTPTIQELSHLIAMKIYNSTLLQWNEDAALTQTHHPNIIMLFIVAVNMTELPSGLHHVDFPQQLLDFEICRSNLTTLPDEIALVWPPGQFLVLEEMQFDSFPDVLLHLRPSYLVITKNNFSVIPDAMWNSPDLYFVNMNGNPVDVIPQDLSTPPPLFLLLLINTNVTRLPTWVAMDATILAAGTPLCDALQSGHASERLQIEESVAALWERSVNCTPNWYPERITHYPIDDEDINNPSRED